MANTVKCAIVSLSSPMTDYIHIKKEAVGENGKGKAVFHVEAPAHPGISVVASQELQSVSFYDVTPGISLKPLEPCSSKGGAQAALPRPYRLLATLSARDGVQGIAEVTW